MSTSDYADHEHGHRLAVTIPADLELALGAEADTVRPEPERVAGRSTSRSSRDSDTPPAAVSEFQLGRAAHRALLVLEPGVIHTVGVDHVLELLNSSMAFLTQ